MSNAEKILKEIRYQIKKHGSQTNYAKAIGVSPQYIGQLLNGRNSIHALSLEKLEQMFPNNISINFNQDNNKLLQNQLISLIKTLKEEDMQKILQIINIVVK